MCVPLIQTQLSCYCRLKRGTKYHILNNNTARHLALFEGHCVLVKWNRTLIIMFSFVCNHLGIKMVVFHELFISNMMFHCFVYEVIACFKRSLLQIAKRVVWGHDLIWCERPRLYSFYSVPSTNMSEKSQIPTNKLLFDHLPLRVCKQSWVNMCSETRHNV